MFVENNDDRDLYWHIFPPRLAHQTLAAIGMIGVVGPNGPTFELQARLAVRVFKGLLTLPPQDAMLEDVARRKDLFYKVFGSRKVMVSDSLALQLVALNSHAAGWS